MTINQSESNQITGPIRQILLQPTPYCNISCSYCYLDLTSRSLNQFMSRETAIQAFEFAKASGFCDSKIDCRWHSGEPLVGKLEFYQEVFCHAQRIFGSHHQVQFSFQTNGLLINKAWIEFFRSINAKLGLSIDGPARFHNSFRVDRSGRPTFERVIRAIELLNQYQVEFEVICVLNDESLLFPDEIYNFFSTLGCSRVGFNTNDFTTLSDFEDPEELRLKSYKQFMSRMIELQKTGTLKIRELETLREAILNRPGPVKSSTIEPFAILNIDIKGNISTFSPELLTLTNQGKNIFHLGNVFTSTWDDILNSEHFLEISRSIQNGKHRCAQSCEYFQVCGGGSPANKLYETGKLDSTVTFFCKSRIQSLTNLLLDDFELSLNLNK